jgi:hypothetical protein
VSRETVPWNRAFCRESAYSLLHSSVEAPTHYQARSKLMTDLHKLLFETKATVSDREVLATARLNARVKAFAGQEVNDDVIDRINAVIRDEADQLVKEGVLQERPDWLAVLVSRRLYVAFGSKAVQHLSRELRRMGAI